MIKIKINILALSFLFIASTFVRLSDLNAQENLASEKINPSRFMSTAVIQALNKNTAKTLVIEMQIGETISFGVLRIIAHKCWQAPLDQKPDSKILLEVFETRKENNEEKEERVFYGWMFASSPSISGIEHPTYDLTALNCKNE